MRAFVCVNLYASMWGKVVCVCIGGIVRVGEVRGENQKGGGGGMQEVPLSQTTPSFSPASEPRSKGLCDLGAGGEAHMGPAGGGEGISHMGRGGLRVWGRSIDDWDPAGVH